MNCVPISTEIYPEDIDVFSEAANRIVPNFKAYILNANEAYLNKNEINLGVNARLCVESLCNVYLSRYVGIDNCDLATKIQYLYVLQEYFTESEISLLNVLRKAGNNTAHAIKDDYIDVFRAYEDFYEKIDIYIEAAYAINNAETLPELPGLTRELSPQEIANRNRFILYSDEIIALYKKLLPRAILLTACIIFDSGILLLFAKECFNSRKGFIGILFVIASIALSVGFIYYMFFYRKIYSPKLAYEVDQKRHNYRIKDVHDRFFPALNRTINYSIDWDRLFRDR